MLTTAILDDMWLSTILSYVVRRLRNYAKYAVLYAITRRYCLADLDYVTLLALHHYLLVWLMSAVSLFTFCGEVGLLFD